MTLLKMSQACNLGVYVVFILVFTSSCLVNNVVASTPSEPHPANTIWIEPSSLTLDVATISLGYQFNVTVWLNVTEKSSTWQVKVFYNSTYFNVTRIGYTSGNKSDFFADYSTMAMSPNINYEEGYVLHGETLLGVEERDAGYGSLIWIELNLTKTSPLDHFTLNFSAPYGEDTFVLTPYFEEIPMGAVQGSDLPLIPEFPLSSIMLLVSLITFTASAILKRRLKNHG